MQAVVVEREHLADRGQAGPAGQGGEGGRFLWEVLCPTGLSCEQSRVAITRAAGECGASRRYRAGAVGFIPWPAARKG